MEIITKFPLVTMEKWQGSYVKPNMFEEDAWRVAAKQIKRANPRISVIVWLDSLRIYTADKALNPDLKPPCTTGHFSPAALLETGIPDGTKGNPHSPYLLQNSSNLPAVEPWSGCHILDHTNPMVRNFWTDMCLNLTSTGDIDGCGADASQHDAVQDHWGLTTDVAQRWKKGHEDMMRNTTKLLGPEGILIGKLPSEVGDYVNAALHESCDAANATINTLRALTARAQRMGTVLLYECHGTGQNDEVAAFLIGAGKYHLYGVGPRFSGDGTFTQYRLPVMDRPLGPPLTDATYDPDTHTWTRSFQTGTKVSFNAATKKGVIAWASQETRVEHAPLPFDGPSLLETVTA